MGHRSYLTVSPVCDNRPPRDRVVCLGNHDCCLLGFIAAAAARDSQIIVEEPTLESALRSTAVVRNQPVPYGDVTFKVRTSAKDVLESLLRYGMGVLTILAADMEILEQEASVSRRIVLREIETLCSEVPLARENDAAYRPTLDSLRRMIRAAIEDDPCRCPKVEIDFSETMHFWSGAGIEGDPAGAEPSWLPHVLLTRLAADRVIAVADRDFQRLHSNSLLTQLLKDSFGDRFDDEAVLEWCVASGRAHDRGSVANALIRERYRDRSLTMASLLTSEPLDGDSWIYYCDWPNADDPTFVEAVRLNRESTVKSEGVNAFRLRPDEDHR